MKSLRISSFMGAFLALIAGAMGCSSVTIVESETDPQEPPGESPPWEAPAPCEPEPEACNGRDDDCNGLVDDGFSWSVTRGPFDLYATHRAHHHRLVADGESYVWIGTEPDALSPDCPGYDCPGRAVRVMVDADGTVTSTETSAALRFGTLEPNDPYPFQVARAPTGWALAHLEKGRYSVTLQVDYLGRNGEFSRGPALKERSFWDEEVDFWPTPMGQDVLVVWDHGRVQGELLSESGSLARSENLFGDDRSTGLLALTTDPGGRAVAARILVGDYGEGRRGEWLSIDRDLRVTSLGSFPADGYSSVGILSDALGNLLLLMNGSAGFSTLPLVEGGAEGEPTHHDLERAVGADARSEGGFIVVLSGGDVLLLGPRGELVHRVAVADAFPDENLFSLVVSLGEAGAMVAWENGDGKIRAATLGCVAP